MAKKISGQEISVVHFHGVFFSAMKFCFEISFLVIFCCGFFQQIEKDSQFRPIVSFLCLCSGHHVVVREVPFRIAAHIDWYFLDNAKTVNWQME